ncbi:MAG: hypothetical protein K6T17_09345 [Fimbriimonadales bacterium]|nr:hypothetical protein [Fimbriimonadales bacterium]
MFHITAEGAYLVIGSALGAIQNKAFHPGMYTERPRPVFLGSHPKRDPLTRGGMWTERTLRDLALHKIGSLWLCIGNVGFLQSTGGGDPESGGPSQEKAVKEPVVLVRAEAVPQWAGVRPWYGRALARGVVLVTQS